PTTSSFLYVFLNHRALHSLPTRRSSDLVTTMAANLTSGVGHLVYNDVNALALNQVAAAGTLGATLPIGTVTLVVTNDVTTVGGRDGKRTRLNFSHQITSYAVFSLQTNIP